MTLKSKFTLIRGDTRTINFSLPGVDLTGGTIFFTAKITQDTPDDASAAIAIEVTDFTDPTNGNTIIPLSAEDTDITPGVYFYDIQFKDVNGNITSIPAGKFTVVADVTRRIS
jgi:hypothetical protein